MDPIRWTLGWVLTQARDRNGAAEPLARLAPRIERF
jgi:hypothetical protein